MFKFLKRQQNYTRRTDGKEWTKNQAVKMIARELVEFKPKLSGNDLSFHGERDISIEFIASNFSDKNELSLNGTLYFIKDGDYILVEDLFSYAKSVYGEEYRALHLYRDEEWKGSNIQREINEAFLPMIASLLDVSKCDLLLSGKSVQYNGKTVTPLYSDKNFTRALLTRLRS